MQMPNSYKETKASGEYNPVMLGGHHLIIKKVVETDNAGAPLKNKNGDPMIIVYFDMAENDVQPRYATIEYQNDTRPDKKWSNACTQYITTEQGGKCTKQFKTFTTCFAHSNGIDENAIKWGDGFCAQFTNMKIGGVFGEVESEYQGKRFMKHDLRWFVSDDKVDGANIPEPKRLPASNTPLSSNIDGFVNIPDNAADSVPWG